MEQVKTKVQTTLDIKPHSKLVELATSEGRTLSKMLEIVCEFYKLNSKTEIEIVSPN